MHEAVWKKNDVSFHGLRLLVQKQRKANKNEVVKMYGKAHVMTALAVLTGVRVMMTLMQEWSSLSSRVVFKGTRTPGRMLAGKTSLTVCCWAWMMSSMLTGPAKSVAAMVLLEMGSKENGGGQSVDCLVDNGPTIQNGAGSAPKR